MTNSMNKQEIEMKELTENKFGIKVHNVFAMDDMVIFTLESKSGAEKLFNFYNTYCVAKIDDSRYSVTVKM